VILGIDGRARDVTVDGRTLGVDLVLGNRSILGSVNAHADDWHSAGAGLGAAFAAHGDVLRQLVALRVAPDRFAEALAHPGVKAPLAFAGGRGLLPRRYPRPQARRSASSPPAGRSPS